MPETLRQFKATVFQALAHPTRIAILEALRDQELPVSVLLDTLGLEPANASQHLAVLRSRYIVQNRKEGNQVFYSVRSPMVIDMLDLMRRYYREHVEEALAVLNASDGREVTQR